MLVIFHVSTQINKEKNNIKNRAHYFFCDIINIKDLNSDSINIDKKSYKDIVIYRIWYVITKGVKTFNIIINKTNGYIEKSKGNKCLPLVPSDESKDNLKTHGKLWSKIKILLDQKITAGVIIMRYIWKSDSIQVMIYLSKQH